MVSDGSDRTGPLGKCSLLSAYVCFQTNARDIPVGTGFCRGELGSVSRKHRGEREVHSIRNVAVPTVGQPAVDAAHQLTSSCADASLAREVENCPVRRVFVVDRRVNDLEHARTVALGSAEIRRGRNALRCQSERLRK